MNKGMIGGLIRHGLTILSVTVLSNKSETIQDSVEGLIRNIASGDPTAIIASAITVMAVIWSMWVKLTEESKTKVMKVMSIK